MASAEIDQAGYDSDEFDFSNVHPKGQTLHGEKPTVFVENKEDVDDLFATEESGEGVCRISVIPALATLAATKPSDAPAFNPSKPSQSLGIEWIHGYRGFDSRSNICINAKGHVVYPVAGTVVVYDPQTRTQRHYLGQDDDVLCLTQHPANLNIIATGQNATVSYLDRKGKPPYICVWDSTDFTKTWILKMDQTDRAVRAIGFSVDGQYLVSVSNDDDHTVKVWDWQKKTVVASSKTSKNDVTFAKWNHKNANEFVTVGAKHLMFWTFENGKLKGQKANLSDSQMTNFYSVAFSEKGYACVGSMDGSIFVFNAGTLLKAFPGIHSPKTLTLDWWPQGIISGGGDGKVRILNSKLQTEKEFQFPAKIAAVYMVDSLMAVGLTTCELFFVRDWKNAPTEVSPDNRGVYPGEGEAEAKDSDWHLVTRGHFDGELWATSVNPSGDLFATAGEDNTVAVWSVADKKMLAKAKISGKAGKMPKVRKAATDSSFPPNQCARSVCWSPDGNHLAAGLNSGEVVVFDVSNLDQGLSLVQLVDLNQYAKQQITNNNERWIQALSYSPSGKTLAAGTRGCIVALLSVEDNYAYKARLDKHNSVVTHLDWSEDGTCIRANDASWELLYHTVDENDLKNSKHQPKVTGFKDLKFATNTCLLTWATQGVFLEADYSQVNCADINPSRTLVATGDDYGNVNIFRYPTAKGSDLKAFEGHSSHVPNVRFTVDGSHIISTGGHDKAIIQWIVKN